MTGPSPAERPSDGQGHPRWWAAAGTALTLAGAAYVAGQVSAHRADAAAALETARLPWMAAGAALAGAAMVVIAWGWRRVIGLAGGPTPPGPEVVRAFFRGELAKYVPGGVWAVVGRAAWAVRAGVDRRAALASVPASLLLMYTAAGLVALGALAAGAAGGGPLAVLLVVPAGAAAAHPRVAGPLARRLRLPAPDGRAVAAAVAGYVPAWILVVASSFAVARALDPGASLLQVALAAPLSWLAGFLAAPAPAGLGVREAVFAATCGLAAGPAAAAALLVRALFVLADLAGFAAALRTRNRRP